MPVMLKDTTKVKNLRYVLNHSWKRIQRLTFGFFFLAGAGFWGGMAASRDLKPCGHDKDSSGTEENGVIPSWTGDVGFREVSMCRTAILPSFSSRVVSRGGGMMGSLSVWSCNPFSASSRFWTGGDVHPLLPSGDFL